MLRQMQAWLQARAVARALRLEPPLQVQASPRVRVQLGQQAWPPKAQEPLQV